MGILFLVMIGLGLYFLFSNNGKSNIKFPNSKSSEDVLKERFVSGDINEETYKRMKETLKH